MQIFLVNSDFFSRELLTVALTNFRNKFHVRRRWREGRGEEMWLQSQEGQELSASTGPRQLNLKMTSEHHTVDHTNKIMGNDHDSIFM
jgi:hypothetical protein